MKLGKKTWISGRNHEKNLQKPGFLGGNLGKSREKKTLDLEQFWGSLRIEIKFFGICKSLKWSYMNGSSIFQKQGGDIMCHHVVHICIYMYSRYV